MTSAQVVETSVTNNSSFQDYTHPDDHTIWTKNAFFYIIMINPGNGSAIFLFSKFSAPTIAFLAFWLAKNSDY